MGVRVHLFDHLSACFRKLGQGGGEGAESNALMDSVYNINLKGETVRGVRPLARHILPY